LLQAPRSTLLSDLYQLVGKQPVSALLRLALRAGRHADHRVIYQKVSTANSSGGSAYGQILQSSSVPYFIARMGG
jgi:CxxC motif-containing protein (DUF1111 family)